MNILIQPSQFELNNTYFMDTKNNIIMDGNFSKIIYSNDLFTINGIYIDFPIKINSFNKVSNKNVMYFDIFTNMDIIQKISHIEQNIIYSYKKQYNIEDKLPANILSKQLQNGILKYYSDDYGYYFKKIPDFYIKISGIWDNHNEIGITYKLIEYK